MCAPACGPRACASPPPPPLRCFFSPPPPPACFGAPFAGVPPFLLSFVALVVSSRHSCSLALAPYRSGVARAMRALPLVAPENQLERSSRGLGNSVATLDADALLRAVFVDAHPRPRRLAALRIDQHHVGDVNRRLHFDDAALLLGRACLAMLLHDVHTLHGDATLLRIDANHLAALPLVVTAHD